MSGKPRIAAKSILDLPSETILAWEQEGFSKTNYAGFHFEGPCNPDALNKSLREAQAAWPNFHANLIPTRIGLYKRLAWQVRGDLVELEVRNLAEMDQPPEDIEAWLHPRMEGDIDHPIDLRSEYPVRFILFLFPRDRCLFVARFHHVVIDGGGVFDFVRDALGIYHRKVTGSRPDWERVSGMHSQAGSVKEVVPISKWRFMRETAAELRKYPLGKAVQIASETAGQQGRNMIRHIITDPALQKALRDRARREGGSLSDLVMAASKVALQEWNGSRGAPNEIMIHGLAVNQRLRLSSLESSVLGNPMSAITIPSNSAERRNPEELLRFVVDCRRRKLQEGHDILLSRLSRRIMSAGRFLPMGIRYPFLRLFVEQGLSFFITNVGVVWPKMEGGRPTGETAIGRVGDMELLDIHSSIGATKKNPCVLILRSLFGKFYMIFAFRRHRIADQDAKDFSGLLVKKLINYL